MLLAVVAIVVLTGAGLYVNRPYSTRLGAFVTDLSARTQPQRNNIQMVQERVTDKTLQSGETFSLNTTAGPYEQSNGFLAERSYLNRQITNTFGGGVCQFASTLYNAALLAHLPIVERFPHSLPVSSVPEGWDATVAYGVADLKFKNPYPFPIRIISRIAQDQLRIEIWGKEPSHEQPRM